jgi:hypothetical protein
MAQFFRPFSYEIDRRYQRLRAEGVLLWSDSYYVKSLPQGNAEAFQTVTITVAPAPALVPATISVSLPSGSRSVIFTPSASSLVAVSELAAALRADLEISSQLRITTNSITGVLTLRAVNSGLAGQFTVTSSSGDYVAATTVVATPDQLGMIFGRLVYSRPNDKGVRVLDAGFATAGSYLRGQALASLYEPLNTVSYNTITRPVSVLTLGESYLQAITPVQERGPLFLITSGPNAGRIRGTADPSAVAYAGTEIFVTEGTTHPGQLARVGYRTIG